VTEPVELDDERPKPVWDFRSYLDFVPPSGFITEYLEYACQCTDAPPLYHILAATSVVSAAISPHLDLVFHGELHPLHIFTLIIGNSSESRKTSAIMRAVKVAEPVFSKISMRGDRLWWPAISSPEGLMEDLSKEPNRLMLLSEWTEMHRLTGAGYWEHASEFINLLYDAVAAHRSRSKVKTVITRPRVTILGASTPGLVAHATEKVDWEGGKLARYLIGHMSRPPAREMDAAVDLPHVVTLLQSRLDTLTSARAPGSGGGNATLSADAWSIMRSWQKSDWWKAFKARVPAHLSPSCSRAPEHVFRVSTIYQCSMSYPFNVQVSPEAMTAAISLVEWCYESMLQTFALIHDEDMSPLAKVTAALAAVGPLGVTRPGLLRRTKVTTKQLNEAIATLGERNEVKAGHDWATGKAVIKYVYVPPTE
jgi:hypothetical protein